MLTFVILHDNFQFRIVCVDRKHCSGVTSQKIEMVLAESLAAEDFIAQVYYIALVRCFATFGNNWLT